MTDEEKARMIEILKDLPYPKESAKYPIAEKEAVIVRAISSLRYKPVILQEHDAEPRRIRGVMDTETKTVFTPVALTGFTIEEVEE